MLSLTRFSHFSWPSKAANTDALRHVGNAVMPQLRKLSTRRANLIADAGRMSLLDRFFLPRSHVINALDLALF